MSLSFRTHEAYIDQAWRTLKDTIILKGIEDLDPSFKYYGSFAGRPVGMASYKSSVSGKHRSIPFYRRYVGNYRSDPHLSPKKGQWAPFFGFDVDNKHGEGKDWFIKPYGGSKHSHSSMPKGTYDPSCGECYGHSRLRDIGKHFDANPPQFDEVHAPWESRGMANEWMAQQEGAWNVYPDKRER